MPLFRCYIKQGKQSKVIIVSANTKERVKQLLQGYSVDQKASIEITPYTKGN